jgi:replicative DNA helicase
VEDEQIEFNETQLQELKTLASTYTGKDRVISFKDIEEQLRNAPPVEKISTKIVGLNNLLHGGLMLETVTVLSACPKSGKTALAMFLTSNMEEYNPLWFALEESTKTLIRKMIKNGLTVPNGYAPAYKKKVSLGWIETRIIEAKEKNKSKVVFIDQLDFIVQQDNQGDRHDLKVAQTMRDIHDMAVRQEVAIVLICHTTSIEPYERPTPKNLRGSSAIWGEADNVLFVWRQCKLEKGEAIYSSNVELSLQANREDGDLGKVKMVFEKGKYIEQEWIDKDFGDFNVKNDFGQS